MLMKINIAPMLKTLLFTMQNGKSISSGIKLLEKTSRTRKERNLYGKIYNDLKDGSLFSEALKKYKIGSNDVSSFIYLAEKGLNFKNSLEKIIQYIDVRDEFERESNDKTTLPFIYFSLAAFIVLGVKFFGVPYQIQRSQEYSAEILNLISTHLINAQLMTDALFTLLIIVASYFLILMVALFGTSNRSQSIAKELGLLLPFISNIIKKFEKFMLFSMLGEMIKSGISYKSAINSAIDTTSIIKYKRALRSTLESIKVDGKFIYHSDLYDEIEKELMSGVGSSNQIGSVMLEISNRSKADALQESTSFFRIITLLSILLMAFAVFIEFYTIVLTQVLIQKGLIDMAKGIN